MNCPQDCLRCGDGCCDASRGEDRCSCPEDCAHDGVDCNGNRVPDDCELAGHDCNHNGGLDECEPFELGDFDGDAWVGLADYQFLFDCLGGPGAMPLPGVGTCKELCLRVFDLDDDGDVDLKDFAAFAAMIISEPPRNGLEAYWKFDGNGHDASGNMLHVNLIGTASLTDGLFGSSLGMDSTGNGYAARPISDPQLNWGISDFTIQAWIYFDSTAGEQSVIEKWQGGTGPSWTLVKLANHSFRLAGGSLGVFDVDTPPLSPATGQWHHLVARRFGSSFAIIWNGTVVGTKLGSFNFAATSKPVFIGRRADEGPNGLNGRIDEVALWSRSLTDGEIQALYNSGSSKQIPVP